MNKLLTLSIISLIQFIASNKIAIRIDFNDDNFKKYLVEKYLDICIRTRDYNLFDDAYSRLIEVSKNLKNTNKEIFNNFISKYNDEGLNHLKEIRKEEKDLLNEIKSTFEKSKQLMEQSKSDSEESSSLHILAEYINHEIAQITQNSNAHNSLNIPSFCSQLDSWSNIANNQMYIKNEYYNEIARICREIKDDKTGHVSLSAILLSLDKLNDRIIQLEEDVKNRTAEVNSLLIINDNLLEKITNLNNKHADMLSKVVCAESKLSQLTIDRDEISYSPFTEIMNITIEQKKWHGTSKTKKDINFRVRSITFENVIQGHQNISHSRLNTNNYSISLKFADKNVVVSNIPDVLDKGMHKLEDIGENAIELSDKPLLYKTEISSSIGSDIILENIDNYDWLCDLHIRKFDNISLACTSSKKHRNII